MDYRGYNIEIVNDDSPQDPRTWGAVGRMLCSHKRYCLGDDLERAAPGWPKNWTADYGSWSEVEGALYRELGAVISLPLYMYDHGGITIRTFPYECPWDSGQIGYIYVTREDILEHWNRKRMSPGLKAKITRILLAEVKEYDQYVKGEVYGYVIETGAGDHVDSCFGYYNPDDAVQEAREAVDWQIESRIKKHVEQVKTWIRNRVPLDYRYPLELS